MSKNYNHTIRACFAAYIVQAIINNFIPLLFLTFQSTYDIPLSKITMLITFNFGLQLLIDFLSAGFIDKIGYRAAIIAAHFFAAGGLILLAVLPSVLPDSFVGLLIAVAVYAVGGGLIEVVVSPIVEACPTDYKEKVMSLLHSFYCWGHVGVVLISTLFFTLVGIENWRILAVLWGLFPLINAFVFFKVPIAPLIGEDETGLSVKQLLITKSFWIFILLMLCAGACEQSVSQWASTFAEKGLGVAKTVGDLAGPTLFAVLMGISRTIYGKYGDKINLEKYMAYSGILCAVSYLMISLSPYPLLGFIGCGICGFSVGILWPGTFSIAAKTIKGGGTAMFAFLALAGDLGCGGGPTLVGFVSKQFENNLNAGILTAIIFPAILLIGLFTVRKLSK